MNIHIVGIKGWGISALAQILQAQGVTVCGSDVAEFVPSDPILLRAGIIVEPFSVENITDTINKVIYSTGYEEDHLERVRCRELGIPQVSYPEAVAELFNAQYGISVCGTHGKTTSSAILAYVLKCLGVDPTAIIGSLVPQFGSNALIGSSQYFVLETDEYQNKLQYYYPRAVMLTSVEWDHPDFFHSEHEYREAFISFFAHRSIEYGVACIDDSGARDVARSSGRIIHTYGESGDAEYRMIDYRIENEKTVFTVVHMGEIIGECTMTLIGRHNALNVLGVFTLCDVLGVGNRADIFHAIETFAGTERRFEYKGDKGNTRVYVDYGHHPTEVRVTLSDIRERFPNKKITCVFGPHTFSRTEAFLAEFAQSFGSVDKVFILDIYGAREKEGVIHARDLAREIQTISHNTEYSGSIDNTLVLLNNNKEDSDILVCMGASEDVWKVAEQFLCHSK